MCMCMYTYAGTCEFTQYAYEFTRAMHMLYIIYINKILYAITHI